MTRVSLWAIQKKPRGITSTKSKNKVFVARDGFFLEKEHLSKMTSRRKIELDEVREDEQQGQIDS